MKNCFYCNAELPTPSAEYGDYYEPVCRECYFTMNEWPGVEVIDEGNCKLIVMNGCAREEYTHAILGA